jgi:AraC-like DNA-binding protein
MHNFNKYLTVSELEKDWGFYVTTVGREETYSRQYYPNHNAHPTNHTFTWNNGRILDGYYLVYITKGMGVFESSKTSPLQVTAGTCFLLFPQVWHRYKPDAKSGWEEYWVGFKGTYPEQLMDKGFFNSAHPFVNIGINENLLMLFHKLIDIVSNSVTGYHQIISGITLQILALVKSANMHQGYENDPTDRFICKTKFLLQDSFEKPLIMEEVVKDLPMSYSKFRKAFKQSTQQSPNQYLLDIRLTKAKELLTYTTLSVNDIAFKTGFETVSYFSNFFKKRNGISPKIYRHQKSGLQSNLIASIS